jgi:glycosyltransferase involved in cell wall biosynthesis
MPQIATNDDVTVVITNYNYGRFFAEALASALQQDGGAPRVIVVDDGSTDPETLSAFERLPDGVTLHRQSNQGLSAARNAGMRLASTPLVLALDADDRLARRAVRSLKERLAAAPDAGFSYGTMRFFGDWEGEIAFPPYDPFKLLYRHTIGSSALMRREVFDDVGGFDPRFRGYEDWDFWLGALARGWHGVRVEEVTLEYRRHGSTMLGDARRDYRSWYRLLRAKHAALYAQAPQLARKHGVPLHERLLYRWYWGPRPIPARVEHALHALLWRARRRPD